MCRATTSGRSVLGLHGVVIVEIASSGFSLQNVSNACKGRYEYLIAVPKLLAGSWLDLH